MDCDLHHIIQSKQALTEMHHKCFAKQLLEGIKAMHSVGVFRKSNQQLCAYIYVVNI
jgi:mitogen-activated protein kinase 7